LVGVAVVSIRDLAVDQGWAGGTSWSRSLLEALDGLRASTGVVITSFVVAVVGALVVWLAVKPGRKTHLRGHTDADLWLSTNAVAALAQAAADRVAGVISVHARRTTTRRITVEVTTSQDEDTVAGRVRAAIDSQVDGLTNAAIRVRTKELPR